MTREEARETLEFLKIMDAPKLREAVDMAIEALQERPPFKIKTLADSTLMSMTKAELIEYIRMCEKNVENAYATLDQQSINFKKLLDEQERPKGRWIENRTATYNAYTDDFEEVPHYNCSLCDCPMDWKAPFCPECGASMVGADMRESEQG